MRRVGGLFLFAILAGFCIGLGGTVFLRLKDAFPEVYCIGDASSPRNALEAVRGACETVVGL